MCIDECFMLQSADDAPAAGRPKPASAVAASAPAAPSSLDTKNWYAEVMELRRRAAEYKLRARGTHFSREHLAQLYARQADLWDTVSTSSTLSALSLADARSAPSKDKM